MKINIVFIYLKDMQDNIRNVLDILVQICDPLSMALSSKHTHVHIHTLQK